MLFKIIDRDYFILPGGRIELWKKFYAVDISRTKEETGLGLAIAKEFTKQLGSNIYAIKNNNELEYNTLEEPFYILFDNDYFLIIEYTDYSITYLDYRKITLERIKQAIGSASNKDIDYLNNYHRIHGWDFDENRNRIEDSFGMKEIIEIHGNYDKISDIQIDGFND